MKQRQGVRHLFSLIS